MNKKIELYTLRRAKSNGTIHFVLSLKLEQSISFSVDTPKTLYFLCNSFSLQCREKSSETKKKSRKVFFMFCLEHFSLNCIIKMLNLKVNSPLMHTARVTLSMVTGWSHGLTDSKPQHCWCCSGT